MRVGNDLNFVFLYGTSPGHLFPSACILLSARWTRLLLCAVTCRPDILKHVGQKNKKRGCLLTIVRQFSSVFSATCIKWITFSFIGGHTTHISPVDSDTPLRHPSPKQRLRYFEVFRKIQRDGLFDSTLSFSSLFSSRQLFRMNGVLFHRRPPTLEVHRGRPQKYH